MRERKKAKQPKAEDLLAIHIRELKLYNYIRQYKFCRERKWRADFAFHSLYLHGCQILIEVDGFDRKGRHGAGWGKDYERDRTAAKLGYFTIRFATKEVLNGSAKAWIAKNLLGKAEG